MKKGAVEIVVFKTELFSIDRATNDYNWSYSFGSLSFFRRVDLAEYSTDVALPASPANTYSLVDI